MGDDDSTARRRKGMTGRPTHIAKSSLPALVAVALVLGAGMIPAAPALADHDDGPSVGFHFFFDLPAPPFIVLPPPPPPPRAYYYQPAPRAVYMHRPYYRAWQYRERYHRDRDDDRHERRGHRHHGDRDDD